MVAPVEAEHAIVVAPVEAAEPSDAEPPAPPKRKVSASGFFTTYTPDGKRHRSVKASGPMTKGEALSRAREQLPTLHQNTLFCHCFYF